jgi:hypothetical protein
MSTKNLLFEHKGILTFDKINIYLSEIDLLLQSYNLPVASRKIIYSISVECLENIYRHFYLPEENKLYTDNTCIFQLFECQNHFEIIAANQILNKNINNLKLKLDNINKLDKKGLKALYKNTMKSLINKNINNNAGIGLIEIAKLSENNIKYEFQKINNETSLFKFCIYINAIKCLTKEYAL